MEVKWIKITTNIFNDEKIMLIEGMPEADAIIVIWFKILCLAGRLNNGGYLMLNDSLYYNEEMLASIFRRPVSTIRLALGVFERFGMIETADGLVGIPNWSKHQSLESGEKALEEKRAYDREYRRAQRAKAALGSGEKAEEKAVATESCTTVVNDNNDSRTTVVRQSHDSLSLLISKESKDNVDSIPRSTEKDVSTKSDSNTKARAHARGTYGYVKLTDTEYDRLVQEYGEAKVVAMIAYVDESAKLTENKNHWKDWNLVIRRGIREGWGRKAMLSAQQGKPGGKVTSMDQILAERRAAAAAAVPPPPRPEV